MANRPGKRTFGLLPVHLDLQLAVLVEGRADLQQARRAASLKGGLCPWQAFPTLPGVFFYNKAQRSGLLVETIAGPAMGPRERTFPGAPFYSLTTS